MIPFYATWSTIAGLALMLVGGLVLWAYGGRHRSRAPFSHTGPEAHAVRAFHDTLARWFFLYGCLIVTLGLCLLLWASANVFKV